MGLALSFNPMCRVMWSLGLNANKRHFRRWHSEAKRVYPSLGSRWFLTDLWFYFFHVSALHIRPGSHMYCEAATASMRSGSGIKTPWDLQVLKKALLALMVNLTIGNSGSSHSWSSQSGALGILDGIPYRYNYFCQRAKSFSKSSNHARTSEVSKALPPKDDGYACVLSPKKSISLCTHDVLKHRSVGLWGKAF